MFTKQLAQLSLTSRPRWRRVLGLAGLLAATVVLGLAQAGDLEPPGPPGPTMKTLDEIPPTWSRVLPADDGDANGCNSSRFECLGPNDTWVLDHQTGLVWLRSLPVSTQGEDWASARSCYVTVDGAWRLPTPFELGSLRSLLSSRDARGMPIGHPFAIAGTGPIDFWTMTTSADDPSRAWYYRFEDSTLSSSSPQEAPKTALKHRICVRASAPGIAVY